MTFSRSLGWILPAGGAVAGAAFGLGVLRVAPGAPLVFLGLGGLTLGLTARLFYRVLEPLLAGVDGGSDGAPAGPAHAHELEREKFMVLRALKEVEQDFQMRKISEADRQEMTARYRARALRILADLEGGSDFRTLIEREVKTRLETEVQATARGAAAPAGASTGGAEAPGAPGERGPARLGVAPGPSGGGVVCTACGTGNDADATFCKRCGGKIAPRGTEG